MTPRWLVFLSLNGLFFAVLSSLLLGQDQLPASKPVATFPQEFSVEVSGQPALATTVAKAAYGAVETGLVAADGATWTIGTLTAHQLLAGISMVVNVPVHVTGADGVTADGIAHVKVSNKGEALGEESVLWFENKPENILRESTLYTAPLIAGKPVRLLYHHTCKSTEPMVMRAELHNPSDQAARVLVVSGDARPNREPVLAGTFAAEDYLPAWLNGSGEVIDIPAHSARVIAFRKMVLGEVMSGLCSLRLLDGGPDRLEFVSVAEIRRQMSRSWELALLSGTPFDEIGPIRISSALVPDSRFPPLRYIMPNIADEVSLLVGDRSVARDIGVEGILQEGGGRSLNGNYGVVYRFSVAATNKTTFPAKVVLDMTAKTSYTSGVFLVDGRLVVLKPLQKGQTRRVFSWTLKAKSQRNISVVTVPISGSAYPNTLHFRTELTQVG